MLEAAVQRALDLGEVGLQVAVYERGRLLAEASAGTTGPTGRPVGAETVFPVFSISKAFTAIAIHVLAERGHLDYDAPVAEVWPEFASNGKRAITVRHVLVHRAGLPEMPVGITVRDLCDWDWVVERLAGAAPLCEPGTRNAYMPYTYGYILGEIVRRADPRHRPFGAFMAEEVCGPLGIDAFWIGLPAEARGRVAMLSYPAPPAPSPPDSIHGRAAPVEVGFLPEVYNRPDVQAACIPAAGGIGSARSVARLFAMLAGGGTLDGVRLLSEATVISFLRPRPGGDGGDLTFGSAMPIGLGGILLDPCGYIPRPAGARRVLSHFGAGGSFAYADLDTGRAFAITHNRMFSRAPVPVAEHPYTMIAEAALGTSA